MKKGFSWVVLQGYLRKIFLVARNRRMVSSGNGAAKLPAFLRAFALPDGRRAQAGMGSRAKPAAGLQESPADGSGRTRRSRKELGDGFRLHQLTRLVEVIINDGFRIDAEGMVHRGEQFRRMHRILGGT